MKSKQSSLTSQRYELDEYIAKRTQSFSKHIGDVYNHSDFSFLMFGGKVSVALFSGSRDINIVLRGCGTGDPMTEKEVLAYHKGREKMHKKAMKAAKKVFKDYIGREAVVENG